MSAVALARSSRVGIVGAGWAGLSAAVELAQAGRSVVLWEAAATPGGRGRSGIGHALEPTGAVELDCGQHILLGAYRQSLRMLQTLEVPLEEAFLRSPLRLVDPKGRGLCLPAGRPAIAFLRALARQSLWPVGHRWQLMIRLARWHRSGFLAPEGQTVQELCQGLPGTIVHELIEPLCVAALNTPIHVADASVFLRVLADGLFSGVGGSDLLIPRRPLHHLLPGPAIERLRRAGACLHIGHRVLGIRPLGSGRWQVESKTSETVDRLILATNAPEAARLLQPWDRPWASSALELEFEPIVTTWVHAPQARLPCAMVRLTGGPAQFAFDLCTLGPNWPGHLSFVSSAASTWLDRGMQALEAAVLEQARAWPDAFGSRLKAVRSIAERRATFRCSSGLRRPKATAAALHGSLAVAGDYVCGPYPSTLEGAVRSGVAAAHQILES